MKKTILGILGIVGGFLYSNAELSEIDFTYAGTEQSQVSSYGSNASERQSLAIKIDDPLLAGYKIKSIKAYMTDKAVFTRPELWLSSELKIEKRQNAPDIMSVEVEASTGEYNGIPCQVLEYNLTEPYEIGINGVFVGSSITTSLPSASQTVPPPFLVYNSFNPNGLWYFGTVSAQAWTDNSASGQVALMVVSLEGENDAMAVNLDRLEDLYTTIDTNFITKGFITNVGGQDVKSLEYSYTVDGADAGTGTIEFAEPLRPNPGQGVEVIFEFDGISSYKEHEVVVTIDRLNGEPNVASRPTATFNPYVVLFVPTHRPLVEEVTGLWCQYCPRGYVAMEEVGAHFGDMVVVCCYHDRDAMSVTSRFPFEVGGYPEASIDRQGAVDPYSGTKHAVIDPVPGIFGVLDERIEVMPFASVDVKNVKSGDFGISFDIETVFCLEPKTSNYEVGYVITANGLSDPDWAQVNNYNGTGSYKGTPLEPFTKLGNPVYGLVYNDVVVNVEAMEGIPGSLPQIEMGETYVHSATIPKSAIRVTDNLDCLVVNAFVIDKSTGLIVNANKAAVAGSAGVEENVASSVVKVEYFDIAGRKVLNPSEGLFIVRTHLDNGKIKTEKKIIKK